MKNLLLKIKIPLSLYLFKITLFSSLFLQALNSIVYAAELNSGYFADAQSGVVWRRCDLGTRYDEASQQCKGEPVKATWVDAVEIVNRLNNDKFEGYEDWRLPTSDDLRSLLKSDSSINSVEEPVTRGAASAFGGYFLNFGDGLCRAADNKIYEVFGSVNAKSDGYLTSHRWMADNSDKKTFQSPLTINYISNGKCNVLTNAFLEDQFDSKRQGEFRAHAPNLILIVRGGEAGAFWTRAQSAVSSKVAINNESRARSKAELQVINNSLLSIKKYAQEVLAAAVSGSGSMNSGSNDSGKSSKGSSKLTSKNFSCKVYCKSGSGPITWVDVSAESRKAAAEYIDAHGHEICRDSGYSNASNIRFKESQCSEK